LGADRATNLLRSKLEAAGVTLAESIMLQELRAGSPASPTTLVQATSMSKGAVSKTISQLIAKGLVARGILEEDHRGHALALTRKGRGLAQEIARIVDAHETALFGHLSQRDRATLLRILQGINTGRG
jgi:DNA-binding MarR family transcriptional regulator